MTDKEKRQRQQTCVSYILQAFQVQTCEERTANIFEACGHCPYGGTCAPTEWVENIAGVLPESTYEFTIAKACINW